MACIVGVFAWVASNIIKPSEIKETGFNAFAILQN
jgi:hypothetical protein